MNKVIELTNKEINAVSGGVVCGTKLKFIFVIGGIYSSIAALSFFMGFSASIIAKERQAYAFSVFLEAAFNLAMAFACTKAIPPITRFMHTKIEQTRGGT